MVESLQNLEAVYAKWQSRNPYLHSSQPGNKQSGLHTRDGGGDACPIWQKSWPSNLRSSLRPSARHLATKHRGRNRRENGLTDADELMNTIQHVAWFKRQPVVMPATGRHRPFSARCCDCMPDSRNSFYSDSLKLAGLRDVLDVETRYDSSQWTRTFCHISYILQRPLRHKYPDVSLAVLTNPRLLEAVSLTVQDSAEERPLTPEREQTVVRAAERRAKSILQRLSSTISNRLIRFMCWLLHKLLGRLLSAVIVHRGQMQMLQIACKREMPMIFLPTHHSHLDYILISFILFAYDMRLSRIVTADDLLMPFFRSLTRSLGGIFVRRKMDRVADKRDHIYRAVLHTYVEQLLSNSEFLEFFVEADRTCSGKLSAPKDGLLSVVTDAVASGVIDDAYIVPVSISYDKLVDGNFVKEQMGETKIHKTFWRTVIATCRLLVGFYGMVRVDFSQPFSVKEYMEVYRFYPATSDIRSPASSASVLADSQATFSAADSLTSMSGGVGDSCIDMPTFGDTRRMVQCLAEHVVHDAAKALTVTSPHLLALLLLTTYRQGADMAEMVTAFDWLKDEVISHDHDVSFVGDTIDVLFHAQHMLTDRLVTMTPSPDMAAMLADDQLHTVKMVPVTSLPDVFELSYYANAVMPVFAAESVLVNVVYSLVNKEKWLHHQYGSPITVSSSQLVSRACELCTILKYEFIFAPPCRTVENVMLETLEQLRHCDLLIPIEQLELVDDAFEDQQWARRFASRNNFGFADSDDEDDWESPDETYVLSFDPELLKKFWFLKRIISPILETYYVAACRLTLLQQGEMPESDYMKSLHSLLKERISNGLTPCAESAAFDTLRNAMHSFCSSGIVDRYEVADLPVLALSSSYNDEDVLQEFIRRLELCRE